MIQSYKPKVKQRNVVLFCIYYRYYYLVISTCLFTHCYASSQNDFWFLSCFSSTLVIYFVFASLLQFLCWYDRQRLVRPFSFLFCFLVNQLKAESNLDDCILLLFESSLFDQIFNKENCHICHNIEIAYNIWRSLCRQHYVTLGIHESVSMNRWIPDKV